MKYVIAILLVLLFLFTCVRDSQAGWNKRVERVQAIAFDYWAEETGWEKSDGFDLLPNQCDNGITTIKRNLDSYEDNRIAQTNDDTCTITFDRRYYRNWLSYQWGHYAFVSFCSTYVHEFGHLLYLGHSDDPKNVMYPSLVRIKECK